MAWMLVSLARTKQALNVLHTDDDAILEFYISAASRAVLDYLKEQASIAITVVDSPPMDSPPDSPPDDLENVRENVAMAVVYLTGIFYRQPDGDDARNFAELGRLPYPVTAMLYMNRDPTLA